MFWSSSPKGTDFFFAEKFGGYPLIRCLDDVFCSRIGKVWTPLTSLKKNRYNEN